MQQPLLYLFNHAIILLIFPFVIISEYDLNVVLKIYYRKFLNIY